MLNVIILIISVLVYISFGLSNLIYILFSALSSFFAAKHFNGKNKKLILVLTITVNLGILLFFKIYSYVDITKNIFQNIVVPIGISYYTFQIISYMVDVYKGKHEPEKSLFNYLLYVMYLPYIFIGPITRYEDVSKSMFSKRKLEKDNLTYGALRILWGMFKKYVIAGRIAIVIGTITQNTEAYFGAYALLAMLLYSIELYSDFSGGIDIVIGVSRILGIRLKENFNVPFMSETLQEFWRRWHIALSSWFRDYVYIPLGGNRCSKLRQKINVIITFVLSGFWHGTTYILWGLFHGIIVAFNNVIKTKWKTLNRIITFVIVSMLWSFFIWTNDYILPLKMMASVFTNFNYGELFSNLLNLGLNIPNIIVLVISVIALAVFDLKKETIIPKIKKYSPEIKTVIFCMMILVIFVFGIYGIGFNASEFIYSKF